MVIEAQGVAATGDITQQGEVRYTPVWEFRASLVDVIGRDRRLISWDYLQIKGLVSHCAACIRIYEIHDTTA